MAVRPSSLRDDLEIAWIVSVDGQARALLPNRPAFTRILVPAGIHEVVVGVRARSVGVALALPIPVPLKFEREARVTTTCVARSRCGVEVVEHRPTAVTGSKLSGAAVAEDQIAASIQDLPYQAPGP